MLMSEKLSDDNFMVFSNKIQISMVKSLLEPMLRPRGRGGRGFRMRSSATLRHLERPLVFARGTMAENYHLKQKKRKKKLEPKAKQALISSRILSLLTSFLLQRLLLRRAQLLPPPLCSTNKEEHKQQQHLLSAFANVFCQSFPECTTNLVWQKEEQQAEQLHVPTHRA